MATLRDIAAEAGTSVQTVSAALNGDPKSARISPERVAQVRVIAEKLGYRRNWRARAFAKQRSYVIGCLFARQTPFVGGIYPQFVEELSVGLFQKGYQLTLIPVLKSDDTELPAIEDQRIDAAVVTEPLVTPIYDRILPQLSMPCVLVNLRADYPLRQYVFDDRSGMHQALDHLKQLGHRHIELWVGPRLNDEHYSSRDRRSAYTQWMQDAGLGSHMNIVVQEPDIYASELASRLADGTGPSAVVGYQTSRSLGLLHELWQRHIRVPEQLSLLGFDDLSMAAISIPPLTVVRTPIIQAAQRAAEELVHAIEKKEPLAADSVSLPETLIVRASTAAPATNRK